MSLRNGSKGITVGASRERRPTLAICGGGNGGHALAVVASQNFEGHVDWLVRSEEQADVLRHGMSAAGLRSTGVIVASADRVRTISADPAEIIPAADVVMIVVPAYAHAAILAQIGPHLKESVLIGCLPTRGGFEFNAMRFISGLEPTWRRRLFGLQTLPWSTRVVTAGEVVHFGAVKSKVLFATMPGSEAPALGARLSTIFGIEMIPTAGFLNLTLGNPGQIVHPGLMYGLFCDWNGEEYDREMIPRFYAHVTDEMGELVGRLSSEAIAVASRLQVLSDGALDVTGVLSVHEWLKISYPSHTTDVTSIASCFRTGPLQHRNAPMSETRPDAYVPDFLYRYLTEDVPYGLVVTKAIAQVMNVETPTIDAVVRWAQKSTGAMYVTGGKLDAHGTQHLPIPQTLGIATPADLMRFYEDLG